MNEHDDPIVSLRQVAIEHRDKCLGQTHRVDVEKLAIGKAEMVTLTGSTGCGKTTLIHAMGCLKEPTSAGEFTIAGQDMLRLWRLRADADRFRNSVISIAKQQVVLSGSLTVRENIALPLTLFNLDNPRFVNELLRRLSAPGTHDLVRMADTPVHRVSLSGGQRQRIEIARALVTQPSLLLLDEPTGNLDPFTAAKVVDYLNELRDRDGLTIVAVTHQPHFFADHATQTVEMHCPQPGYGVIQRVIPAVCEPTPTLLTSNGVLS